MGSDRVSRAATECAVRSVFRLLLPGLAGHIANDLVVTVVEAAATVAGVLLAMCADGRSCRGHAAVVDHAFVAATLRQLARVVSAAREALHAGETVAAGAGVRAGLLGTVPNPGGGRVVTYHGWPLYTYLGDASAGHAAGQGKDDNS